MPVSVTPSPTAEAAPQIAPTRSQPRLRVRRWWRWGVRGLAILSALTLAGLVVLVVTIIIYGQRDHARPADAIIVLGGGTEGTPRRAAHAVTLYEAGYAPVILCAGGVETGSYTEAQRCAATLREHGIPARAILLEERSLSTEENALESEKLMQQHNWQNAILVSDNYHLLRAQWLFSAYGMTVYTSPAQETSGPLARGEYAYSLVREIAAVGWYVGKTVLGLPYTRTSLAFGRR